MKTRLVLFVLLLGGLLIGIQGVSQDYEQQKKISGVVTDTAGNPLEKVEVLIKGTNVGAYTDAKGKYVVYTSASGVLVFSKKGMKTQEVKVGAKTEINVIMRKEKKEKTD